VTSERGNQDSTRAGQVAGDLEVGFAHHKAARRDLAEAHYRRILARAPGNAEALHVLGVIAHERGQNEEAARLIASALSQAPNFAMHQNLGNAVAALGHIDEAAASYRAAIALNPDFAAAHSNLAAMLLRQGSYEAALASANRALALMPDFTDAHRNRDIALIALRRFAEAEAACREALVRFPHEALVMRDLGHVLTELKRPEEALEHLEKAASIEPGDATIRLRISAAHFYCGDPHASEAACRQALALEPNVGSYWSLLGQILRALGRFDEARNCFQHALELDPGSPSAYGGLAVLGEQADSEDQLVCLQGRLDDVAHPTTTRADAGFALGLLLDNAERHDEAFAAFAQANTLYREMLAASGEGHDREAFRRRVDNLIETCTPDFYAMIGEDGNPSEMPVFVVGMPRSGTSLVEQIAATHSRVAGAGELPDIGRIVGAVEAHGLGRHVDELDPDFAARLARGYSARLATLSGGAPRVIDKMPDNILHLGLLAVLFPAARVIICRRDPRDIALSCYFRRFDQPIPWAYDLIDCGHRALEIERLADHWRRVLPLRMLTIDYEALVADLEGESRRLIAFLGLDWEPACLHFHETDRPILTASGWQVRQPLFTSSVGRWRRYERHMRPLLGMLAEHGAPA
jgi:tetratricopeptide (TPR) repeat protein